MAGDNRSTPGFKEPEQIDVAASEGGRAQRGDDSHLVPRIVDGPEAIQQVADFLGFENQRRALAMTNAACDANITSVSSSSCVNAQPPSFSAR